MKKDHIKHAIEKLANKIFSNRNIRVGFKTRFLSSIMRMMQNKGWGSSPEEKEYWKSNGWLPVHVVLERL